jgi:hypothetical protein
VTARIPTPEERRALAERAGPLAGEIRKCIGCVIVYCPEHARRIKALGEVSVHLAPGLLAALDLAERALIEVVADGEWRDHYDTCSHALNKANSCDCGLGIARAALIGLRGEGGS